MKKDNPLYPFQYRFVDDKFNQLFLSEMLVSKLSRVFAALAICISCLGLFGLAAFTAERRTKEIGIRKVLGAGVMGLAGLLSGEFLKLIAISSLLAFPVAWYAMHSWLQNYAYHITINWWVFVAGRCSLDPDCFDHHQLSNDPRSCRKSDQKFALRMSYRLRCTLTIKVAGRQNKPPGSFPF